MKIIITVLVNILLAMSFLCSCGNNSNLPKENAIKLGTSKVEIQVISLSSDSSNFIDNSQLTIHINTLSIFEDQDIYNETILKKEFSEDGKLYYHGEVSTECQKEICNITFYMDNVFNGGMMVQLNQDQTIKLVVENINGQINRVEISDSTQPTALDWQDIALNMEAVMSTWPGDFAATDRSLYDQSWQDVRKNQYEVVWPKILEKVYSYATIPESAKDWVINNIKLRFASQGILPYTGVYNYITGKNVEEPPMEAYTYLDSIDYSPEIFLTKSMLMSQRNFLSNLLRYPCGGFEAIVETPVKEWQEKLSEWLTPAMKERPKLLLDLLAGMSYVIQIDREQTPLSNVQKKNIEEGFTDDIGKIVLKRNEKLEEALSQKANLQDLSEQTFRLQEFIDTHYPGQPVVVDMWNTWCGPCLQAMTQTEEIKGDYDGTGLVFLYVSDVSSNFKEWENRARMTGGEQVRINEESKDTLLDGYSLTGFPSYLFFDKDHNLIYAQTAFPGLDRYRALLNQITGR